MIAGAEGALLYGRHADGPDCIGLHMAESHQWSLGNTVCSTAIHL